MKCPECDSERVISYTDQKLRRLHLLIWQCFDCGTEWETGWDIDMPLRPDIIEHCKKYAKQIQAYIEE